MSLEKLVERILRDAREHSERINSEALKRKDEILSLAEREAGDLYARNKRASERAAEEDKKQKVTMAALDARKEILAEKQGLIREAFDRAMRAARELPDDQYVSMIMKPILSVVGGGEGEMLLSPADRERLGDQILSRLNEELERAGRKGRLTLSEETRDITGGFILREEEVEINNSLEAQMSSRREELEPRVVEILFGDVN